MYGQSMSDCAVQRFPVPEFPAAPCDPDLASLRITAIAYRNRRDHGGLANAELFREAAPQQVGRSATVIAPGCGAPGMAAKRDQS